jgi:iron complex transport system substrate-binding protein
MNSYSQRIVSLQPSVTATLDALGELSRVVACTRYCGEVCPSVRSLNIPIVQDSWTAQAEQIIATRPDLVIASVPYQLEAVAQVLKSKVRFLGLAPTCLADIYGDIAIIAGIVDQSERGQRLIDSMTNEIAGIRTGCASLPKLRVHCEEWGKPIIHSQPWVAELVDAAGGIVIGTPGQQTSAEAVRDADPEVIIAAWCGTGDRVPLEKIIAQRNWQATSAARNGRVLCVSDELLNTPAHTLLGGLRAIAWALHPEDFPKPPGIRQLAAIRA